MQREVRILASREVSIGQFAQSTGSIIDLALTNLNFLFLSHWSVFRRASSHDVNVFYWYVVSTGS
jgi:hypothetical protein